MKKDTLHPEEVSAILEKELATFGTDTETKEIGTVLQVGDGVVRIYGLSQAQVGELITFSDKVQGLILHLAEDHVGAIILGSTEQVKEGDIVHRSGKVGTIDVGEGMIGRVVNALGKPIDGQGPISGEFITMPLERKAPGVIYRQPVQEPLQTGIKAIDAMIPIGRGQRELIIGDRQTGKTTIAIDTILSQHTYYAQGDPVYCIYVAIGLPASTVAEMAALLTDRGAMAYTTIFTASASDSASLQFIVPFAATALGEYFRDTGRSALIIYDDFSKHANAYREVCLLLDRPPGREAYPSDIFYLHARILERAGKISNTDSIARQMNDLPPSLEKRVKGGGSLTALPIIETQAGDISAYIPTNVISITDGQIFLDTSLFHANIRPAVNVGTSVSRVGSSAQAKMIKEVAGRLKLDQAQFRALEAFAQFSTDIDPTTQRIIARGQKNQVILTQPPHQPCSLAAQIVILYIATQGYLDPIPLGLIKKVEKAFLAYLQKEKSQLLKDLQQGLPLDKERKEQLAHAIIEVRKAFLV